MIPRSEYEPGMIPRSEYPDHMTIKARLEGHAFDLQDLADMLPFGATQVRVDGDGYVLTSREIDERPPSVPLHEVAAVVLRRVNGLARVRNPDFRPVQLSGRYSEGENVHIVLIAEAGEIRVRTTASAVVVGQDGIEIDSPPQLGPERAARSAVRPHVVEALGIMGQPGILTWADMYKVYEIVRDETKPRSLEEFGWATASEVSAFTASANRPDVSGSGARHARMAGDPPKQRMGEEQGRAFLSRVVTAWIDAL